MVDRAEIFRITAPDADLADAEAPGSILNRLGRLIADADGPRQPLGSELPAHFAPANKIGECAKILLRMLDSAGCKRGVNAMGTGIVDDFCSG